MKLLLNRYFYHFLSALVVITLLLYFAAEFIKELWWFDTLNLSVYFITRELYKNLIVLAATVFFSGLIYINLALVPKICYTGIKQSLPESELDKLEQKKASWLFSNKVLVPLALLFAMPILVSVYLHWVDMLLYLFSSQSPLLDPVFNRTINYYLFSFPVFTLLQTQLISVLSILLLTVWLLYRNKIKKFREFVPALPKPARIHLSFLFVLLAGVIAWSISFQATELLYVNDNEPVYFGPGLVEMRYELPLIWLSLLVFIGFAASLLTYTHAQRGKKVMFSCLVALLLITGLRQLEFIPDLIKKLYVKPNPLRSEKGFIQNHIDATLDAFDLSNAEIIQYPLLSSLTPSVSTEIFQELYNIPLWDHQLLQDVFKQLQAIRSFYTFSPVTVDRYHLQGKEYQVNIAARELLLDGLPYSAQNWENSHMKYTHGYGAAVNPASQRANHPMRWYLSELSLQTGYEKFELDKPQIYYGLGKYPYAIVPNKAPTPPSATADMLSDYQGSGGMKFSSLLTRMIFSAFMSDPKIFFSTSVTGDSKLLIRRNIVERVNEIAPFLQLDANPYPVIAEKRIFWIMDAYTTSDRYPLVRPIPSPIIDKENFNWPEQLNYIRNSIKIVVDAYNGSVDFYVVDPDDAIAQTYRRIFPHLFKPADQIPKPLIKHLSYPQDLFRLQMKIYSRYHQTRPEVFYQQSEALELAQMGDEVVEPYYLTIDILDKPGIPESEREKFILVSPLSPIGRHNLYSIAIAGCLNIENCNDRYAADIFVYNFPESIQVDGPSQISALIDQNPNISRQFSLWNQGGSKVIKGRMFIIPVERTILYIQPIYLAATSKTGFPQLTKVIVAMNQQTAIGDTIEKAYQKLANQQTQASTP